MHSRNAFLYSSNRLVSITNFYKSDHLNECRRKHLLTPYISEISNQIQKNSRQPNVVNLIILNIDNEALEFVEFLILSVLDMIHQQLIISISNTIDCNTDDKVKDIEVRIRKILPKLLGELACQKSHRVIQNYKRLQTSSQQQNLINIIMMRSMGSRTINLLNSDGHLIYPIELLASIFKKELSINDLVNIFVLGVLEFITKDILRFCSLYARNLNKYSVSKKDVCMAIYADRDLSELFLNNIDLFNNNSIEGDDNGERDIGDDELSNSVISNLTISTLDYQNINIADQSIYSANSVSSPNIYFRSDASTISASSSNSDSTLCNEYCINDTDCDKLYELRIKEFIFEQNQHLNDLNLLRKVFKSYLQEAVEHVNEENKLEKEEYLKSCSRIANIFTNINEVYECALKLSDLVDECLNQSSSNSNLSNSTFSELGNQKSSSQLSSRGSSASLRLSPVCPQMFVAHAFSELAYAHEFEFYETYACSIRSQSNIYSELNDFLSNATVTEYLNKKMENFVDICRYLLPKLLLAPVYYAVYLNKTVENLMNSTKNEDEKRLFKDTLDTLKSLEFTIAQFDFGRKKQRRPIETSIRIIQPSISFNDAYMAIEKSIFTQLLKQTDFCYFNTITESKLKHLESCTVDSSAILKTQTTSVESSVFSNIEATNRKSNNFFKTNNSISKRINTYLHDSMLHVCKTNQQIPKLNAQISLFNSSSNSTSSLASTLPLSNKYKVTEKVAYLFDGILYLFKKQTSNNSSKLQLKYEIILAKCNLVDRHFDDFDDVFFELHYYCNSSQDVDYFLFQAKNSSEKLQWMSSLCYVQYKFPLDRMLQNMIEEANQNDPLPIPPPNYRFDQPDTADSIIFETDLYEQLAQNSNSNDTTNQTLIFNKMNINANLSASSSDGPAIKAATLVKLVERLTHHLFLYPKFSVAFLMCYREFCTPRELFDLLVERFNLPDLSLTSELEQKGSAYFSELSKRFKREYQQPIKLKVINVLKHWIEGYFYDFTSDHSLLQSLNDFIDNQLPKSNKRYQEVLKKILQKKKSQHNAISYDRSNSFEFLYVDNDGTSYPIFEIHLEKNNPIEILTVHPLEFARQATLLESELFKAIKPNELISLGWTKADKKHELSPNISKLINLANKFTYWYAKCIVDTTNLEERVAVMQRILDIAGYFNEMNNLSGLMEIHSALETSSVIRLSDTKKRAGLESHPMYKLFKELFDSHNKGYLERLKKCKTPCVPFIGIHLTIIVKTHEFNKINKEKQMEQITQLQSQLLGNMNSTKQPSNLINFSKYRVLVEFVTELLQYQNSFYKFRIYRELREFLEKEIQSLDEIKPDDDDNESTDDQADIIQSWLFKKSKQIENTDAINKYPRLRKFNLKSPSPKHLKSYQPDGSSTPSTSRQHLNFSYTSLNRQVSSTAHVSSAQNSPALPKTKRESETTKQSSFLVSLDNHKPNSQLDKPQKKRNKLHELSPQDKLSISSTDSSAPSSPPPNYEDVIYLNHTTPVNIDNCFDNPTYFHELPLLSSSLNSVIAKKAEESNDGLYHNFKRHSVNYSTGSSLLQPSSSEELSSSYDQVNVFCPQDLKISGFNFNERVTGSSSPFNKWSSRVNSMSFHSTPPQLPPKTIPNQDNLSSSDISKSKTRNFENK